MSITPPSLSGPWDFQAQELSWMEGQYSEIDFIQFNDTALKSTPVPSFRGESWLLGLTSTSLNATSNIPSPATSSFSALGKITRESSNPDGVVDITRSPRNAPRKRPGRYKNAPVHVLNRRREQCRVAQQKHRERKDNRLIQLETESKTLKEEYQAVLNAYTLLDKAYKPSQRKFHQSYQKRVGVSQGFASRRRKRRKQWHRI
ncbi:hypothetical protein V8C34DRAFT_319052 [Trichoderma compactum]